MTGPERAGVVRFVLAWLIGGAAVAALLVVVLEDDDTVPLPPVRQTQLEEAARVARCELRHARAAEALNPPVDGPAAASPLEPGFYDEGADQEAIVAALRRGTIVVHYRPDLAKERLDQLRDLQRAVPEGTIVVSNSTRMPYEVAVTSWRKLLGCPHFADETVDAMRLFRGRFIGTGPDRRQ